MEERKFQNSLYRVVYCITKYNPPMRLYIIVSELALSSRLLHLLSRTHLYCMLHVSELALSSRLLHPNCRSSMPKPIMGFRTRSIESFTASWKIAEIAWRVTMFQNSLYRVVYCIFTNCVVYRPTFESFRTRSIESFTASPLDRCLGRCSGGFRTRSIESFTASPTHSRVRTNRSSFRTRSIESFTASNSYAEKHSSSHAFQNSLYRVVYCIHILFVTKTIRMSVSELALSSRLLHPLLGVAFIDLNTKFQNSLYRVVYCIES